MAKVINTRPSGQNKELSALLSEAGFEPVEIPLVDIIASEEGLMRIRKLQPSGYTAIFLSSPNGIRQLQAGLDHHFEVWLKKPFYLVGGKSKPLVEDLGGRVAFFPEEPSLEGFLKEYPLSVMEANGPPGMVFAQRWLHPCSESTRLDPAAFRKLGVEVENIAVYRPGMPSDAGERIAKEGGAMAAMFCSGSAVENFFQAAPEAAAALGTPKGMMVFSIGPSTSRALREGGVVNLHEAATADNAGLVEALRKAVGVAETQVLKKNPEPAK
jgi:uroporphyrinogen-III synthase